MLYKYRYSKSRSVVLTSPVVTRRVQNTDGLSSQSIHMAQSRFVNHSLHIAQGRFFNQVVHMVHARLFDHCPMGLSG